MKLKLQKLTINDTQSIFHISVKNTTNSSSRRLTFFANNEKSDVFQPVDGDITVKYNKNCLYAKDENGNKTTYYNMYDSTTAYFRSYFYSKPKSQRTGMTYDMSYVYNHKPSSHLLDSTQAKNFIYALEPKSVYGHLKVDKDLVAWLSSDNGQQHPQVNKINTVIYNHDKLIQNVKNNIISNDSISCVFNNVEYNMIHEMPGTVYNDYESGIIASHVVKGKNQYDCEYSMQHNIVVENDKTHISSLMYIRNYIGIGSCNNQVYLKYDNRDYITDSKSIQQHSTNKYGINLPNIEVIKKINRTNDIVKHSTTLYSIDINVENIFKNLRRKDTEQSYNDFNKMKNNVILEIKNCVRAIAETIQPANVQLYHVYVNGE